MRPAISGCLPTAPGYRLADDEQHGPVQGDDQPADALSNASRLGCPWQIGQAVGDSQSQRCAS